MTDLAEAKRADKNGARRALTAAAETLKKKLPLTRANASQTNLAKQTQAYTYLDDTPEVGFSGRWIGRSMGRARLIAGIIMPNGDIEEAPDTHPGTDLVAGIAGGVTGQSQFLEAFGPHLVVAGEAWIIIEPRGTREDWHVVAVTEVERSKSGGGTLKVTLNDRDLAVPAAGDEDAGDDQPLAIRVWNPHPAKYTLADSPVMSCFTILDELRLLNASVAAIAKSRLGGRGLLPIPAGSSLPDDVPLMDKLLDIAEIAYKDPGSAAAVVPIVIEVPDGSPEIKLVSFASAFDELAIKLREEAIRRYATSSDTPAEVLLGQADINHWGVWAVQDEAIRTGVEPRLATVCDGLTSQWYQPALQAMNAPDVDRCIVWYDTSGLRVRSNRSQTAIELGKDGTITGEAVRRETGFDDADAPSLASARLTRLLNIAATVPSLGEALGPRVIMALNAVEKEADELAAAERAAEDDGTGSVDLPVDETTSPPENAPAPGDEPPTAPDVLAAAVDGLIVRALERAGHRLMKARPRGDWKKLKAVTASSAHTVVTPTLTELGGLGLLAGAWERVPELAERYDVDADCLGEVLDTYTKDLLVAGLAHDFKMVPLLIKEAACLSPPLPPDGHAPASGEQLYSEDQPRDDAGHFGYGDAAPGANTVGQEGARAFNSAISAREDEVGFSGMKNDVCNDLAARTDGDYERANLALRGWATNSNDSDGEAITRQNIAQETFGLKDTAGWRDPTPGSRFDQQMQQLNSPAAAGWREKEADLQRAQYEATQQWFRDQGITHVTLERGFVGPPGIAGGPGSEKDMSFEQRPLSSWTTDRATAATFANGLGGTGEHEGPASSYLLQATFPVERILSTPLTGFGCTDEREMVVLGGTDQVRVEERPDGGFDYEAPDYEYAAQPLTARTTLYSEDQPRDEQGHFGYGDAKAGSTTAGLEGANALNVAFNESRVFGSEILTGLAERSGLTYEQCKQRTGQWAMSSGGPNDAVGRQEAVRQAFDLKDTASMSPGLTTSDYAREVTGENRPVNDTFYRANYEATQEFLRDNGVKEVTLYRGIGLATETAPSPGTQSFEQRPMSSWTTDPTRAGAFADKSEWGGTRAGYVMTATFPAERVLSTGLTGIGTQYENEVVVLGGTDSIQLDRAPNTKFA